MLPDGLVRGGFLRAFPRSLRGSSEAGFPRGFFQCRRGGASRGARLRRLSTGFSNGGAARSAAVPFCPSLPRRPAVLLSLPAARTTMPHEHIPVHANRRAVPTLFHIFLPPGRTSFFTQPSCQRYRAPLLLHPFVPAGGRDSAAFFAACTGGGAVRSLFALSAARPALHLVFCTPPPATGCRARSPHPSRPPRQPLFPFPCFRATGAPMRTGGQSLLFPLFSARIPRFRAAATHDSFPLLLRAAAPVRGCSRRISPSISAPLCLPRSPLLCARPFRAGFFGSAPPCSPPPRAVSGPVPARADVSRRSFAFPRAPGLCARRARPGHPCRRAHPGRPRRAPPFASVRIPPCRRAPFFSIARQESEHKRRILYEHMFV